MYRLGMIMCDKSVQEKYESLLRKYNEVVESYVPKYKVKSRKNTWYNVRCAEAKRTRDRAWKKLKYQRN